MPRALTKTIVVTENGIMILERDNTAYLTDRDGVTLGKIPTDKIGGIRNWLSDFLNRSRVNARREGADIITHAFKSSGTSVECAICGFRRQHRAHRTQGKP